MDTFCFAILYFTQCRLCLPLIIEEILLCLPPFPRFLLESRDYGRITTGESCTGESCFKNPGLYTALKSAVNSRKVTKKVLVFQKVARRCSLTTKLLKILKVAEKLPSRIWIGLAYSTTKGAEKRYLGTRLTVPSI